MLKKKFNEFLEQKEPKEEKIIYKPTNIVQEVCVAMLLLNHGFLDNILDKGLKHRYMENSSVFLTDLKNLLLAKNRLRLGKFVEDKCVEDEEISKVNGFFDEVDFDISDDWQKLVNSRNVARNIIDKLSPDEKLTEEMVRAVYWIGPNKDSENKEDLVVELTDGKQYSFFLNKNLSTSKSASFTAFLTEMVGDDIEFFKSEKYLPMWNKLVQQWVKILYENANKNIQAHIEKFIDTDRIESLDYFSYYELKHRDPRFKHLGEYIKEVDRNVLYFSDLMGLIWKNKESCFFDVDKVYKLWMETKVFILNSRILEHFLTTSLTKNHLKDIKKLKSGYKMALSSVKMKLIKTLVEKMGCSEKTTYYLSNNGNVFTQVPSRKFFRENYKDIKVKFDYHVKLLVDKIEENNDFTIDIKLYLDKELLMSLGIVVKFTSYEMNDKLTAKYQFELPDDFNFKVSKRVQ